MKQILIIEDDPRIAGLERDLGAYRIQYDRWFKESSLHEDGSVQRVIDALKEKGVTYEQDGALWFKASAFGNDRTLCWCVPTAFPLILCRILLIIIISW